MSKHQHRWRYFKRRVYGIEDTYRVCSGCYEQQEEWAGKDGA